MRPALVILCGMLLSCQAPPTTFTPVDAPSEWQSDWVRAAPVGATTTAEQWDANAEAAFAGEVKTMTSVRATASPMDFYGSALFDGFDLTVQPLDNALRGVKRLGSLTVVLYDFDVDTLSGQGGELMRWHVPATQMRTLWKPGRFDAAYRMKLAWTRRPSCDYVKMSVRFTTFDGEVFALLITPGSIDQPRYRWLTK